MQLAASDARDKPIQIATRPFDEKIMIRMETFELKIPVSKLSCSEAAVDVFLHGREARPTFGGCERQRVDYVPLSSARSLAMAATIR